MLFHRFNYESSYIVIIKFVLLTYLWERKVIFHSSDRFFAIHLTIVSCFCFFLARAYMYWYMYGMTGTVKPSYQKL